MAMSEQHPFPAAPFGLGQSTPLGQPAPEATGEPPPGSERPQAEVPSTGGLPAPSRSSSAPRRSGLWVVVVVVAAVVGAGAGVGVSRAFPPTATTALVPVSQLRPGPALVSGTAQIPAIVHEVLPSVVSIDATGTLPGLLGGSEFGVGVGIAGERFESAGTGMIVSSTGLVLTNNHVVAGATRVAVTLDGQTSALPATVVGTDPSEDMALVRIDHPPAGLRPVRFASSSALEVGDGVVAIGNALGLSAGSPTVTSGIISALGRSITATVPTTGATETLTDMIQTDAPINPGNSGGPLVDAAGAVVGMNTATAGKTSNGNAAQDIGFAIPSTTLVAALPGLERGGQSGAPGASLGVVVEDDSPALAAEYGFAVSSGAVIDVVEPGSPAAAAGLEPGEVITAFDGHSVASAGELVADEEGLRPGQRVPVTVWNGSVRRIVTVTLGTAPAA